MTHPAKRQRVEDYDNNGEAPPLGNHHAPQTRRQRVEDYDNNGEAPPLGNHHAPQTRRQGVDISPFFMALMDDQDSDEEEEEYDENLNEEFERIQKIEDNFIKKIENIEKENSLEKELKKKIVNNIINEWQDKRLEYKNEPSTLVEISKNLIKKIKNKFEKAIKEDDKIILAPEDLQEIDNQFKNHIKELVKIFEISALPEELQEIFNVWETDKQKFNTIEDLYNLIANITYFYKDKELKRKHPGTFKNVQKKIQDLIVNNKIFEKDGQKIIKAWKDENLCNELINLYKQKFKNKKEENRRIVHDQLAKELEKLGIPYLTILSILRKFNKQQNNKNTMAELLIIKENFLKKYEKKIERDYLENIFFNQLQHELSDLDNTDPDLKKFILIEWKDKEQNCKEVEGLMQLYDLLLDLANKKF
jgi:hypothetical protein